MLSTDLMLAIREKFCHLYDVMLGNGVNLEVARSPRVRQVAAGLGSQKSRPSGSNPIQADPISFLSLFPLTYPAPFPHSKIMAFDVDNFLRVAGLSRPTSVTNGPQLERQPSGSAGVAAGPPKRTVSDAFSTSESAATSPASHHQHYLPSGYLGSKTARSALFASSSTAIAARLPAVCRAQLSLLACAGAMAY